MKTSLIETYYRLLQAVPLQQKRYLYPTLDMNQRLIGLIGARGTGKTTLLLQYLREQIPDPDKALYVSADHIYFSGNSLLDFIREQVELNGRTTICLDEIHKYPGWNQEVKNLYDSYPQLHLAFSGSSSIDLIAGSHDLSRRALLYRLEGLSFREFLEFETGQSYPVIAWETLLADHQKISRELAEIPELYQHFTQYLQCGFYPFYVEDRDNYPQRLLAIIEKTIYGDIASHHALKTSNLHYFKKIITFLATSLPGEFSINSLSRTLGIDHKTLNHFLEILDSAGLIRKIGSNHDGAAGVRKPEKIFLANPNLYQTLHHALGKPAQTGTIRESFFLSMIRGWGESVFYSPAADYIVRGIHFEIGGRNKTFRQIKEMPEAFLVKDQMPVSGGIREIPLYLFGFLY